MRFNEILKSKRVWAVIGTIAVVVLKDRTSLSEQQILEIVALVSALIVGDSLRPVAPKPDEVAK
jgi:nitrate/nitrite transporter NarK